MAFVVAKLLLCTLIGMGALPLGILPSIFLFRDLANGTDAGENSKRSYAVVLWSGMLVAWALGAALTWWFLSTFM